MKRFLVISHKPRRSEFNIDIVLSNEFNLAEERVVKRRKISYNNMISISIEELSEIISAMTYKPDEAIEKKFQENTKGINPYEKFDA